MKLNYIVKVAAANAITEIYLATLAAVKREIATQKRLHPGAQITYFKRPRNAPHLRHNAFYLHCSGLGMVDY